MANVPALSFKTKSYGYFNGTDNLILSPALLVLGGTLVYGAVFEPEVLGDEMFVISDRGGTYTNVGIWILTDGRVYIRVVTTSGGQNLQLSNSVAAGVKVDIRVEINTATGFCQTYVDGIPDVSTTFAGTFTDSAKAPAVGREQATSLRYFKGKIYRAYIDGVFNYDFNLYGRPPTVIDIDGNAVSDQGGNNGVVYPIGAEGTFWRREEDPAGDLVDSKTFFPVTNPGGSVHNGADFSIVQTGGLLVDCVTIAGLGYDSALIPYVEDQNGRPKFYTADLGGSGKDISVEYDGTNWQVISLSLLLSEQVASSAQFPPKTIGSVTLEHGPDGCFYVDNTGELTKKTRLDYDSHPLGFQNLWIQYKKDGGCIINQVIQYPLSRVFTGAEVLVNTSWAQKFTADCGV